MGSPIVLSLLLAHVGEGDAGLINGLMHPVLGLDHLLAMVSVGVVSSQLGGNSILRVPAAFVSAMSVGAALGVMRVPMPFAEQGICASVIALGAAVSLARSGMSPWPIMGMVSFFGVLHGHAHGTEIPRALSPVSFTLGFLIGTCALHVFGVLVGEFATLHVWLTRALRLAGSAVMVSGVVFLLRLIWSS